MKKILLIILVFAIGVCNSFAKVYRINTFGGNSVLYGNNDAGGTGISLPCIPNTGDTTASACGSFIWYGTTYTVSGTPTYVHTNHFGCDSTVTLHLTIYQPTTGDTTAVACSSFSWYGTTYTVSGTPTYILTNQAGCDSTITLHLTITQPTTGDTTAVACSSFTWYGTTYTSSTSAPTITLTNKAGCDSLVTLHLTITQPTSGDTTATACGSFKWYGTKYTATGTPTYILTNKAGCDSTVTLHLTINTLPTVSVSGNVIGGTTICAGMKDTLMANATGTGTLTYAWSTTSTKDTAIVTTAAGYSVVVTDANGCKKAAGTTVIVNALPNVTANVSPSYSVCTGSSVTLTGGGASSYKWTGGVNNGSAFSPASTATYTVTGTDGNGCMNTSTAVITVNPLPDVNANASPAGTICQGADVTLSGGGASSYTWSNGVNDGVPFRPASTITYTVTGYDAFNCTNTATITVAVNPSPTVAVTVTGLTQTICQGDTVGLIASGASSYIWKPSTSLTTFNTSRVIASPLVTTTYTTVGTNVIGCSDSAAITITVNPAPLVTITGHDTILQGNTDTLVASGASSFIWQTGSYKDTIAVSPTVTTTYTVTGIDSDGCKSTGSFVVVVDMTTSVNGINSNNNATLFPNPATGTIFLSCKVSSITPARVAVHDMTGREINSQSVTLNNGKALPIDISTLSEGIYFIKLSASGKEYVLKFIKE